MNGVAIAILLLAVLAPQARQGRLRPPDTITCDRNKLTSFSGAVTQWSRDGSGARLAMNTDAGTRETFSIRFEKDAAPEKWFLLGGEIFSAKDWSKVEAAAGRVKPGIEATVWVCEGSANPVVDWRLPPQ
jgi:hypothetical protein